MARPSAVPATPAQGSEEPLEAQAPEEAIDDETADEPDLREASSVEEWIKAVVEAKSEPYRIPNDPELHTAEIKYINGEIVAGVNSDFKTVEKIEEALLKAKVKKKDVDALVANAKKAKIEEEKALGKLMKERNLLPGANKKGIKPQATKRKRTKTTRDARTAHTEAINRLLAECAAVQKEAWDLYSDVLEVNLMPAGALFEDKISTADKNHLGDYRTGKDAAHAIPIVWYKAPADYPKLQLADGTIVPPFGDFSLGSLDFGVAPANQPKKGWVLRKIAHDSDRANQVGYNKELADAKVALEEPAGSGTYYYFNGAGYDGDHVKDLGFSGKDEIDNYWPLLARINRRAFEGYNARYVVNYLDDHGRPKARPVGGLIGKYFKVKSFMAYNDGAVPNEKGTSAAGRDV